MHTTSKRVSVALWAATAAAAFGIGWITPPPHPSTDESPAPVELAASIHAALGEGDVIEREARVASLLERLDSDSLPEVVVLYERMIPLIGSSELAAFFAAWARFDPVAALEHVLSWPLMEMRDEKKIAVGAAIQVWAQRHDPVAAKEAAEQIGGIQPRLRVALARGLVTGWLHSPGGQEGLVDFLADLPRPEPRGDVVKHAVRELVRKGGADAALAWADPILRDEGYDALLKGTVFDATADSAAQWDPERAAAWVGEHSQADYAERGPGIVTRHWGRQDGAAAMAWLGEQPAGALRDKAVRGAFGRWTRTDSARALVWLNSEELTAIHDPALEVKAERLAPHVPDQALGWCERIQDPTRQQKCLVSTARSWYGRDAVAAEAWLQQSSLDDEARSLARKVPGPQGQKGPRRPGIRGAPR